MSKKQKACKKCRMLYDEEICPNCEGKESTDSWKGKLIVLDPENSEIGKKFKITRKGSYAIKTR